MSSEGSRYIVGIDLGTTHCALGYADLRQGESAPVVDFPIHQLVALGETAPKRLLPSNIYLPGEQELPRGALRLPWGEPKEIVGELAKRQGARVPGRMVGSAKSWLCHAGVDRTAPILPWGGSEGVLRLSPVQASALYLGHLRDAWNHGFPGDPLGEQEIVLTVPASFDEVARELTVRAAREAGLNHLTLLEEPQAAFYDWSLQHRGRMARALGDCRLILVCDVGGGTTDFTLIYATAGEERPAFKRIAVGDHILLGGDNMDASLARRVESRLGVRLDASQWSALVQACREAKETLLGPGGPDKTSVSVVGRGSRLAASALSAELSRDEVRAMVLDGFFPRVRADETPARLRRGGLQELGLPYAADPAITRHAAAFLRSHAPEVAQAMGHAHQGVPRPDALLLNGGVFAPEEVVARIAEVMGSWWGEGPLPVLDHGALDLAVARGAVAYGLARRGLGMRIGGGAARAYFVGVETQRGAQQALCLIPRGMEELAQVEIPKSFTLVLDRPVRFELFASSLAQVKQAGELVAIDEETFQALPPIRTVLGSGEQRSREVPVKLHATLTEIGTLELWCAAAQGDARWKLEFQLRSGPEEASIGTVAPMPKRFAEAREMIERVFGKKPAPVDKKEVKGLWRSLERVLGSREEWATPLIRELWAALHASLGKRRRSSEHERIWCSLTGFCLRPGFGAPLDSWRAAQTWAVFEQGLQFQGDTHNWETWWVLWRRIAGGLDQGAQKRLFDAVAPVLRPAPSGKAAPRPKGIKADGLAEMIRMAASLERIEADSKAEMGYWLLERIEREGPLPHLTWAIGRLGARVPFYGSEHACVAASVAEEWANRLLAVSNPRPSDLAFALAQLVRMSGDRAREVAPSIRQAVEERLVAIDAPEPLLRMVREVVRLGGGEEQQIFGESLPAGLKLVEPSAAPPPGTR